MDQENLTGQIFGAADGLNFEPMNPADPVGEIMRRLDLMTGLLGALIAINRAGQADERQAATLQALTDQADYLRDSAAFIREYQQKLRAVFADSPAGYDTKTLALNDAIYSQAGGTHKFPAGLTGRQLYDDFLRRLAEYQAPVKEKEPGPVDAGTADAPPVNAPADDFAQSALRLLETPRAPRFDLLKVIASPSSVVGQLIPDVAARAEGGRRSLKELEKRESTHGADWVVTTNDERAIVTRKSDKGEEIKLGIYDLSKFKRRKTGTSKKFAKLLLSKAGYEFNGTGLSSYVIALNAAELVGLKMYGRKEDAREGILAAVDAFRYYGMWGNVLRDGKMRNIWLPFITAADSAFDGDDLLVKINPDIKWANICTQFTYMPALYFSRKLSARAADLLEKVYTIARMKGSWLYQHAAFYVELSTVAEWLRLPDIKGCKYARKYIKNPVYNAISNINTAGGGEALSLVAPADDTPLNPDLPVTKWILGRLRVDIRKTPAWISISDIFAENRRKAGAAARQKIAVKKALAIDAARAKKKKAATDKKKNARQAELAAKYAAAFGGADATKEQGAKK